jgi:hypothetical protein
MSKRVPYEPPIELDKLNAMMDALQSGAELTGEIRAEIVRALAYAAFIIEREQATAGRPRNIILDYAANAVHLLVKDYGASVKAAACAVLPGGDAKDVDALQRRYRKLKNERKFSDDWRTKFAPDLVAWAAARLPKGLGKRK